MIVHLKTNNLSLCLKDELVHLKTNNLSLCLKDEYLKSVLQTNILK
jgi:hypothetical protein